MICGWIRMYDVYAMLRASGDHDGRDVQPAVRRDAHLIRAVVVGDVDLFSVPRLDRIDDALVVAIRHERQLRPGDAAQAALALVNVVGNRVRRRARISQRDVVVDAAERDAAAAHAEQAHFHLKRIARPSHRSLDDGVGAKLAPAIEGDRIGCRRLLDGLVGVARNHVELALEREIVPQHFAR